jgi:hypothetical protein
MNYRDERGQGRSGGAGDSSPGVVRLFGQMMLLPFTVFAYGMELFVRTLQGMQRAADQGMDVMAGGLSPPRADGGAQFDSQAGVGGGVPPPGRAPGDRGDHETSQANSDSDHSAGDAAESTHKETGKMADKDLNDDQLKLVRYKILFVKRDYEVAFPEREELVHDNISGEAFTAWKVAEFIQRLDREPIPDQWRKKGYPRKLSEAERKHPSDKVFIDRLDETDKKYLRVYYEVLERYVREEDDSEVDVLKEIRDAINSLPRIEHGSYNIEAADDSGGGGREGGSAGGGRGYSV